jgi:hypothetical protein
MIESSTNKAVEFGSPFSVAPPGGTWQDQMRQPRQWMCRAIGLASDVPKKTASLFKDVAYE